MYSDTIARKLENDFWEDVSECRQVTADTRRKRSWFHYITEKTMKFLAPIIKM
jgi:hypothetical protein